MPQQPCPIERLACLDGEEWRHIPGWGEAYAVSSHGRVARLAPSTRTQPGQLLAGYPHPIHRYRVVQLSGPRATVPVHRLVWAAFRGEVPAGRRVAHADDNPVNDRLDNLRLATYSEQTARLYAQGRIRKLRGEANPNPAARLTTAQQEEIRATLGRETAASVAARYGVSKSRVDQLRRQRSVD